MTRVIVWKELREQGTIVAALLVTGCGIILGLSVVPTPQSGTRGLDALLAVGTLGVALLTTASGTVVASTLFAGEREAGTFAFLDRLPLTRWQLWWRKVVVGLGLTAVSAVGYFVTALVSGVAPPDRILEAASLFGLVTYFGFAWGCVGSVLRRTALGACAIGLSIGVSVTAVAFCFPPLVMALVEAVFAGEWQGSELVGLIGVSTLIVPTFAALVFPLALSARLFTAPDRAQDVNSLRAVATATAGRLGPVKRFAWLLVQQHRVNVVWLTATAAVAGLVLLIPDVLFITAWPAATLVVGVLIGVTLFADEQGSESARFWGERRLRVGGVWGAKLAFGFTLTFGLVVLMLVPCVVRGFAEARQGQEVFSLAFRTGVPSPSFPFFTFLFVGPVYGLVVGQLAALLFRKVIVALAVGTMVGGAAVALWFPSLFGGGLHGWQVFAPAVVTLAVSRLLSWPWATDALGQRGPILRLAGGLLAVTLTFAGGIAWRVLEVPEVAEANDDIAFAQSLPTYDQNESGRGIRQAVAEFGRLGPDLGPLSPTDSNGRDNRTPDRVLSDEVFGMLLQSGYPADRPDLDAFLKQYDGDWEQTLLEASRKPTGVFVDPSGTPQDFDQFINQTIVTFNRLVAVYALRGLKAQRDGDPADFVRSVGVLLAVVRSTRTSGPPVAVYYANAVEEATYRGVQHWLKALRGHPESLRQLLTTLLDHERLDTYTPRRTEMASQMALRNAVNTPSLWLPRTFGGSGGRAQDEADVIAFAWAVPWERERMRRAVSYGNAPWVASGRQGNPYLRGAPGLWLYDLLRSSLRQSADNGQRVGSFRGCVLQVALRLHEAEAGRFPATLSELVPKYLPALPLDPFAPPPNGFGYRLSLAGESIPVIPEETVAVVTADQFSAVGGAAVLWGASLPRVTKALVRELAPGQPVVWSVGPDRIDGGGTVSVQAIGASLTNPPVGDIVYVVPLPAKAKSP